MIQINAAVSICVISLANADLAKNVTNDSYVEMSLFVKFLLVMMNLSGLSPMTKNAFNSNST